MQVVALTSQKGGSGKTTLTGHMAVEAVRTGNGPVAVIDTDPQGSMAGWGRARASDEPAVFSAAPGQVAAALTSLRAEGFKLVFVDTPPAVTEAISQVVSLSDMVLIPTRPSPHDLRAVGATVDIVEAHEKAMIFVVNSATRGARITAEAAVALSQHGTVAPVTLHHRVDYAASMIDGRTVMEKNEGSKSAKEVIALWEYVADRLDRLRREAAEYSVEGVVDGSATVEAPAARPVLGVVSGGQPRGGFGRRRPDSHPS
ncbi:MAG: AAA family ATPase [Pseudomonadota bacterium]